MSQFNTAVGHSLFLEATALIESLICCRLESVIGGLRHKSVEFGTLGDLLKKLDNIKTDVELKSIMNNVL